jgi:lipoprotein-anchoring transpeptidase ErfK/SrfK
MVQFPHRSQSTGQGRKHPVIVYGAGILLLIACIGLYACKKRADEPPVVAPTDQTAVQPAPAAAAPVAAPAASVGSTLAPTAPVAASTGQTSPEAAALIAEANAAIAQNDVIKARDTFKLAMGMPLSSADMAAVKSAMTRLSDAWLFNSTVLPGDTLCSIYNVKSGDRFINIAKNCKTDYEILMKINNIAKATSLRAGQNIKVVNGPFRAVVNRSTYTLDLYLQNTYVRSFTVGLGKLGRETPTGLWEVSSDKQIKPKWTDPDTGRVYQGSDPDYPLGTRWIGLKGIEGLAKGRTGFALHGTNKPEELGQNLSRGCIRLANPDVELLYSLLAPYSSQVSIVD